MQSLVNSQAFSKNRTLIKQCNGNIRLKEVFNKNRIVKSNEFNDLSFTFTILNMEYH